MNIRSLAAAGAAVLFALAGSFCVAGPVRAQSSGFPDVPQNHWAYQAVQDLANKGYVKGYPNGKFLGGRALTRFEFATVIDRMAQTLDDLSAKVNSAQPPTTPTGAPVTQDDLNKIQVLVDTFQQQLTAIQSTAAADHAQFEGEMDKLRSEVADLKKEADNSYGAGPGRKYTISGYVQTRYLAAASSSEAHFPQGNPAANSGYNGTYSAGGNNQTFLVRRSRLRVSGQITPNSAYAIQIDAGGFSNNTPSSNSNSSNAAVSVKEGWASYTFGNGSSRYPTLTAGQFATPFGYELPVSSSAILTPERPLAFSEDGDGLFASQDYDRGVQINYAPSFYHVLFAAINGTGTASLSESRHVDTIYQIGAHTKDKVVSGDFSYYDGHVPFTKGLGTSYVFQKKQLWDVDAQVVSPSGPFILGEYLAGTFEQRSFFGETATTATNPFGLGTAPAPGNKVKGYYIQGGWTWGATGAHPFSLFASYDVLNRSDSGVGAGATGGASGSSFDDVNFGYGLAYNPDKAIRFRLYYIQPSQVAHAEGTPEPERIGLTTAEMQVKF